MPVMLLWQLIRMDLLQEGLPRHPVAIPNTRLHRFRHRIPLRQGRVLSKSQTLCDRFLRTNLHRFLSLHRSTRPPRFRRVGLSSLPVSINGRLP